MSAWAFVVGINKYPEASKLGELFGAVSDAADFADWALDPGGGQVLPERMLFWTHPAPAPADTGPHLSDYMQSPTPWPLEGPDFTKAPTSVDLMSNVQKFTEFAVDKGATRIYVFLGGHGAQTRPETQKEDGHRCFIASDFLPSYAVGLVSCDLLGKLLNWAGPREVVLFFDCCRNMLPVRVGAPADHFLRSKEQRLNIKLGIGRAAQKEQVAWEIPIDHPTPTRGAFSKLVVDALRTLRIDGALTFLELGKYVSERIEDAVKPKTQSPDFYEEPKTPTLVLVSGDQPDFVDLRLTITLVPPGTPFLLVNESAEVVRREEVSADGHNFHLPIGSYSVELEDGSVLKLFNLMDRGQTNVEI